jgi:hypothetical protein
MEGIRVWLLHLVRSGQRGRKRNTPEEEDHGTSIERSHRKGKRETKRQADDDFIVPVESEFRLKHSSRDYIDRTKKEALLKWKIESETNVQWNREQKQKLFQQSYPNGPCATCEMIASKSIFSHHDSKTLNESAKAGCPICTLFHQLPLAGGNSPPVIIVDLKGERIHYETSSYHPRRVTLEIFKPNSQLPRSSPSDTNSSFRNLVSTASAREIHPHPDSPECYSLAILWLQKCVSKHGLCNQVDYQDPPTRLLELVGNKVCLRRGANILETKPLYTALTYCWGMEETLKTTRETLDQYEEGIELRQLPLTLHDAVVVTRNLGLKYIWIDALCIVQDSQDDWEAECARMGDYYRFSYVTISPLQVLGANTGFLKPRPNSLTCPSVTLAGSHIGLRRPIRNYVRGSPLSKRGWTLQERLLATRILHYGEDELLWECLTCSAREGSTTEDSQCEDSSLLVQSEGIDFKRCLRNLGNDPYSIQDGAFPLWYRIVRLYTGRLLTFPSDKLPAISAIARVIGDKTGSEYFSGIFQSDLHGLAWCDQNNSSKSSWPAPSWSWASVEGLIRYPFYCQDRLSDENDAKFVSYEVTASSGCLTIQALSKSVTSLEQKKRGSDQTYYWSAHNSDLWECGKVISGLDLDSVVGTHSGKLAETLTVSGIENVTAVSICERTARATNHTDASGCKCLRPVVEIYTYFLLVVPDKVLEGNWRRIGMGVCISAPSCVDENKHKQKGFHGAEWNAFSLI